MLALSQALGGGFQACEMKTVCLCGKIICLLREVFFLNFQCQETLGNYL